MTGIITPVILNALHDPKKNGCGAITEIKVFSMTGKHTQDVLCSGCGHIYKFETYLQEVERQFFHSFGDESDFEEVVVFGLATLHEYEVRRAEQAFTQLKLRFGVPSWAKFHSRVVFNGHQRRKSLWKDLSENDIFKFAGRTINCIKDYNAIFSLGGVNRHQYITEWSVGEDRPPEKLESKHLSAIVWEGARLPLRLDIGDENIKYWIDQDRTKISWLGKKTQAYRLYKTEQPIYEVEKERVSYDNTGKPLLLQVADLFAYAAAHALSVRSCRDKELFESLYRMCDPKFSSLLIDPYVQMYNDEFQPSVLQNHNRILNIK